jgi:NDP-sugar pyrophosphorylase family protein
MAGAIIAAGEGSRLRRDGWAVPKPLVPVNGRPLIEHAIGNFAAVGVPLRAIIVNEQSVAVADHLRSRFPDLAAQILVRSTRSSLESLFAVLELLPAGRALVTTVDTWCPPGVFAACFREAERFPADAVVLAVTTLVDDERPLWVTVDQSDGRITRIGGPRGNAVTAGIYLIPDRLREERPGAGLDRLRDWLTRLSERGEPVYAAPMPIAIDVDRAEDIARAEAIHDEGRFVSMRADR